MSIRVAVNGFGRIGRLVFKAMQDETNIQVLAINDLTDIKTLAYLLKCDTVHNACPDSIRTDRQTLIARDRKVEICAGSDPSQSPWRELGVNFVIEAIGRFCSHEGLKLHLQAGARKIILTVPAKGDIDNTVVMGVNLGFRVV